MKEDLKLAIKVIIGAQLIAENSENLIINKLVKGDSKYRLKILNQTALKFIEKYWSNMDNKAEIEYQNIIRNIESFIEKINF